MNRIEKLYAIIRSQFVADLSGRSWTLGGACGFPHLRYAYWCGTNSYRYDRQPCRELRRLIAQLIRTGRLVSLGEGRFCAAEDYEELTAIDDRTVTVAERGVW